MEDLVSDCLAILDSERIQKCHVVGHSLGGSVAQLFTVLAPERLLSAIAVSAPILATGCPGLKEPDPEVQAETWSVFMENPMYADPERGVPEFLKVWRYLNGSFPLDEEMARAYTEKIYETESIEPAWNHTAVQEHVADLYPRLRGSTVPLLCVHGQEDRLVQNAQNMRTLAEHLDQVDFRIIEGAGHVFFNMAIWDQLEDIVAQHLSSLA